MIKQLKYFSIILIAFFISSCNGQSQPKSIIGKESDRENKEEFFNEEVEHIEYGAGDIVTKGYLDKSGNIWFTTTKEGIYKYNGKTFTNITVKDGLCSNEVWAVIEDNKGLLWFATAKGLCSYDGINFVNIPLPQEDFQSVSPETGFPSRKTEVALTVMQDSKGHFWIGTNASGAYQYDADKGGAGGKGFTSFLKFKGRLHPDDRVYNNCITSIIEDRNGNIWFTSITHGGISRYNGESITNFTTKDGLLGDMTNSSFEDKAGNIWFGSIQNLNGGLMRFDPTLGGTGGEAFKSYTKEDGLCDSNVACFYEDESGNIWIGTGDGVCYFDGKTFTSFNSDGQKLGDIRFIIKDREDNMWLGGRYGVLYRYDGNELKDFTQKKRNK
jgi:ligand-binding sensor domain-containing protein